MQTAVAVNVTARVELAVALITMGAVPNMTFASAPKEIVCAAWITVKLCTTLTAAAKLEFPAWLAVIEQVPAPENDDHRGTGHRADQRCRRGERDGQTR